MVSNMMPLEERLSPAGDDFRRITTREYVLVFLILTAYLGICVGTVHLHIPWGDEVQTTDAAINLSHGLGFRSMVYMNQNDQTFWVGNVPLYAFVMSHWLDVFGYSTLALRSLNYVLVILATWLVWWSSAKLRICRVPRDRILLVLLLLTSGAISFAALNVRYDAWGYFLVSIGLCLCTVSETRLKAGLMFLLGIALPFSGVHLPPYVLMLMLALFIWQGWRLARIPLPIFIGSAVGTILLFGMYWKLHVIPEFMTMIHTEGGQTILQKLGDRSYYFRLGGSLAFFIVALVVMLWTEKRAGRLQRRSFTVLAAMFACGLPIVLFIMRRFTQEYWWLVAVPVVFSISCGFSDWWNLARSRMRGVVAVLLLMAGLAGFPHTVAGMVIQRHIRDYRVVEAFIGRNVSSRDNVVCTPEAYFAAKRLTLHVYIDQYFRVMSLAEKRSINVLIIPPEELASYESVLGRGWKLEAGPLERKGGKYFGRIPSKFEFSLAIFRRSDKAE